MGDTPQQGSLELRLLGRFAARATAQAGRLLPITAPRQRAVLAYLAMQPDYTETREKLATLLWADSPDKQARQSLRQCLLDLRGEFAGADVDPLIVDRQTVALDPNRVAVDARLLLASVRSDDPRDIERANENEFGEFLEGVNVASEPFEEWLRAARTRVAAAAALVLQRNVELAEVAKDSARALRTAERLVALDPTRESAQRLLLRLIAQVRGRDAALAQADAFAVLLRGELDAEPEPETGALIASIRQSTPAAAASDSVTMLPRSKPAMREPSMTTIASPLIATPAASSSRHWTARVAVAVSVAALCAAAVVYGISLMSTRTPPSAEGVAAQTSTPVGDRWRTPVILANTGVDQKQLADRGLYPLIVLPFSSETPQESAAAQRITDDLINDLSRVQALRVIARNTSRLYAGQPVDVAALADQLGIRYAVEGSVQLQGDQTRINVALIDAKSRLQVWSDRIEQQKADRFDIQDQLIRGITRHLHVEVLAEEARRSLPSPSKDGRVNALLAKGWSEMVRFFELGAKDEAGRYFEEVLKRQPNNSSAMLGLAGYDVAIVAAFLTPQSEPYLANSEALLNKLLRTNPESFLANYYLAVLRKLQGRSQEALAGFAKVADINPSFPYAYANAGHVMYRLGRADEAMEHVRYAIQLSPKDPGLGVWSLYAGDIEIERRNDDAALQWLKQAIDLNPRSPANHGSIAALYALRGDRENAARHIATMAEIAPWLTLDVFVDRLVGTSKQDSRPKRLIEGLRKAMGRAS